MTVQECYRQFGGDYQGVLSRLRNEKIIRKFLIRFLDDPSYDQLEKAVKKKDREAGFIASHTLKGVCQNLGLDALQKSASAVCELLRNSWNDEALDKMKDVDRDYLQTVAAIHKLETA